MVQNFTDAEVASRELIKEAYTRGSSDNITCVVVRFDPHPNATSGNWNRNDKRVWSLTLFSYELLLLIYFSSDIIVL